MAASSINRFMDWLITVLFPPQPEGIIYCSECGGTGQSKYWGVCSHCNGSGIIIEVKNVPEIS